jgi:hypothetical protein
MVTGCIVGDYFVWAGEGFAVICFWEAEENVLSAPVYFQNLIHWLVGYKLQEAEFVEDKSSTSHRPCENGFYLTHIIVRKFITHTVYLLHVSATHVAIFREVSYKG